MFHGAEVLDDREVVFVELIDLLLQVCDDVFPEGDVRFGPEAEILLPIY